MLSPGAGDLLGAQELQVLAQAHAREGRVDDVVHEAALGSHHRVRESVCGGEEEEGDERTVVHRKME